MDWLSRIWIQAVVGWWITCFEWRFDDTRTGWIWPGTRFKGNGERWEMQIWRPVAIVVCHDSKESKLRCFGGRLWTKRVARTRSKIKDAARMGGGLYTLWRRMTLLPWLWEPFTLRRVGWGNLLCIPSLWLAGWFWGAYWFMILMRVLGRIHKKARSAITRKYTQGVSRIGC